MKILAIAIIAASFGLSAASGSDSHLRRLQDKEMEKEKGGDKNNKEKEGEPAINPVAAPVAIAIACGLDGDRTSACGADVDVLECCEGFVCAFGTNECAPIPTVEEETCAEEGERAQDCGADNSDRPMGCCGDLVCNARGSPICIVAPIIEEPAEEEAAEASPLGCAADGERAVGCGAGGAAAAAFCCEGFVCAFGTNKCIAPPVADDDVCAVEGDRSKACGADPEGDRPSICCEGLVCADGASPMCVVEDVAPPAMEEGSTVAPPAIQPVCAAEGEKAQSCGAENPSHPVECCGNLVCASAGGGSVKCVPPLPTLSPAPTTGKPTMAPTTAPPTTAAPTDIPKPPTDVPTAAPAAPVVEEETVTFTTQPEDQAEDESSALAAYASRTVLAVCIFAPLIAAI